MKVKNPVIVRHRLLTVFLTLGTLANANAQPDWSVNTAAFQSSLAATVSVSVAGQTTVGAADRLAAFVGEEIRGVAPPTEVSGEFLFFLLVYADGSGESVTFRYYDASNDRICEVTETIEFVPNAILGGLSIPLELTGSCVSATLMDAASLPQSFHVSGVYPNPATNAINVVVESGNAAEMRLTVFDLVGRAVISRSSRLLQGINRLDVPTTGLTPGTYFVVSETSSDRQIRSFAVGAH
ncbi:MAG: hypothetical protein ACI80V_003859 [Rhodothermales bacterium]|jgi:hypothetical protein